MTVLRNTAANHHNSGLKAILFVSSIDSLVVALACTKLPNFVDFVNLFFLISSLIVVHLVNFN